MIKQKATKLIYFISVILGLGALSACNSDESTFEYVNPMNLAVTSFSLTADYKNPGLDSVYFTIDLEHGVIFNADSLRKGTKIDKLIPKITFSNNVSEATIIMTGGTTREGEVDYKTSPTDSIDFTGKVQLRVKADKDKIGMTYTLKVNVHKIETDSLFWEEISYRDMPTRLADPQMMKTVEVNDNPVSLVEEKDGTYSRISYQSLADMKYTTSEITLPFVPQVQTLCASGDEVWILDTTGKLWKGDETLTSWNDSGEIWSSLIGTYNSSVVGIKQAGDSQVFAQYPVIDIVEKAVPEDFPVKGFSNFVTLANKWTLSPVAFFTGGVESDGTISDSTWAFDGAEWIKLGTGGIPPLEGASIIPYYHFRRSSSGNTMIEYNVWMLLGGREPDGSFNRDVYISYDNGVNWTLGTSSMQLPEIIPAMFYCDNIVVDIDKSSNLSDVWKTVRKSPRKVNYWVDGDIITWECPYIYLFGGYSPQGKLYTSIWRGVLGRLTFVPVI